MPPFTRREILKTAGVVALGGAAVSLASPQPALADPEQSDSQQSDSERRSQPEQFQHGVASGDPLPNSVLLWTRVTPSAVSTPGSGVGPATRVRWELAKDRQFQEVVANGTVSTGPQRDHTVKVIVNRLAPGTDYWYRFRVGSSQSPVGKTHTAPPVGARVDRLRMGVVSCANWQAGYFAGYRHLAERGDLDLVLHLGDYIYEYAPGEYQARDVVVRPHDPPAETTRLEQYRRRLAQYKTDPDLQALHAAVPFIITWDDHEFANDAWSGGAENHTEGAEGVWAQRRAQAQQAYAEWMPVRYEPGGKIYRRFSYGQLASISMLDLRSYRSKQAASPLDPAISSPSRTITGEAQMTWLLDGLSADRTQWKLIGNPVMITPVRFPSTLNTSEVGAVQQLLGATTLDGVPYNVDQWDGYTADRNRVVRHLRDNSISDAVFLTGDIHSGWATDIPANPLTYPANGESVAVELVCTSITSDNLDDILRVPPRTASLAVEAAFKAANPHVKYLDFDSHGFSVLEVTPAAARMDWYVLAERMSAQSPATRSTSWQVAAGSRSVTQVDGGVL